MQVVPDLIGVSRLAKKRQKNKAEHVKSRQAGGNEADDPNKRVAVGPSGPENFVFAEKAREREDAADGERRDQHRPECNRRVLAQSAHAHQILFSAHRVDHASGSEEKQRLKKRMCHQVKNAG